jgi:hypothetical protein
MIQILANGDLHARSRQFAQSRASSGAYRAIAPRDFG